MAEFIKTYYNLTWKFLTIQTNFLVRRLLIMLVIVIMASASHPAFSQQVPLADLTKYVNPFIGVDNNGNTLPGPCVPFGMVKLSTDCGKLNTNSGYKTGTDIKGFSHTHVSGTGGGAKYGNVLVMAVTGELNPANYASPGSDEQAKAGYYSVFLSRYQVKAELTASHSVGFHRYTFPASEKSSIIIDAGSFLSSLKSLGENQELVGSEISHCSANRIEGYTRVRGGWNKGGAYTVYFCIETDKSASSFGTWTDGVLNPESEQAVDHGNSNGAYLTFQTTSNQTVQLKAGISFISCSKARENINIEIPSWDFEKVRQQANDTWNKALNSIIVKGGTEGQKSIFYTALYHTMIQPTDRTGENPCWKSDEPYYDDYYAIWDTYRTVNPLLILIQPDRERDIIRSLIDIYRHEGYMPDARSGNINGRTQGGSNCDMLVAEAFLKGISGIDYKTAYQAMITNATIPPGGSQEQEGRGGINEYINLGYVPTGFEPPEVEWQSSNPKNYDRGGSRTLEYAANDWAIAQFAKGLGYNDDFDNYKKRASNWANLWQRVNDHDATGFIWPKKANGTWLEDFSVFKNGGWANVFYESNSWEYSFYVPHDVRSLIDSCGGKQAFVSRLDTFFTNGYFQVNNEPGFLSPCLYIYAGRPDKTTFRIKQILNNHYSSGRGGLPGNDDSGAMSAWYVFNAMGFFPNAGQDVYLITSPIFDETTIQLSPEKTFTIKVKDLATENPYIISAKLDGKTWDKAWFTHGDIINGGTLELLMGNKPGSWGITTPPPSMSQFKY